MKRSNKLLLDKLMKSNLNDSEIVTGIFDIARNENDIKLGRQVREIAAYRAKTNAKEHTLDMHQPRWRETTPLLPCPCSVL